MYSNEYISKIFLVNLKFMRLYEIPRIKKRGHIIEELERLENIIEFGINIIISQFQFKRK